MLQYLACSYKVASDDTASLGLTIYMTERVSNKKPSLSISFILQLISNEKVSGGSLAIKIAIALSAFGNMIAVAFTSSKGSI
jgi:hypothetical protein